jgi:hypothetical protein
MATAVGRGDNRSLSCLSGYDVLHILFIMTIIHRRGGVVRYLVPEAVRGLQIPPLPGGQAREPHSLG